MNLKTLKPFICSLFFIIISLGQNNLVFAEGIEVTSNPPYIPFKKTSTIKAKLPTVEGGSIVGVTVNFELNSQGCRLSSTSAVTDSSGIARVTLYSGNVPEEATIYADATVTTGEGKKISLSGEGNLYVFSVEIKASDGESDPPKFIVVDQTASYYAKTLPIPLTGTFKWDIIKKKDAEIQGSATSQSVTLKGISASEKENDTGLKVMFKPTSARDYATDIVDVTVVGVEVVHVDATIPHDTKIYYHVGPLDVVLSYATFTAPGKTETKTGLTGYFYFTYNQNNLDWDYESDITPEIISLSTTIYGTPQIVDCTANRIRRVTPQAQEQIVAYFIARGVGLRTYTHGLFESYHQVSYSVPYFGKTIWVGTSDVSLVLWPDYNNIGDDDWTETHNYTYSGGSTSIQDMITAYGIGNPNTRYKESSSDLWPETKNLDGVATVTSLMYHHATGVTPATSIGNKNIDRSIP